MRFLWGNDRLEEVFSWEKNEWKNLEIHFFKRIAFLILVSE